MLKMIKKGWKKSSEELAGTDWFWARTAGTVVLMDRYKKMLAKHARGDLLDAGAGTLSCRHLALPYCGKYESLDLERHHVDITHVGDVQRMPLPDCIFDTVISMQVLEHVPNPTKAVAEMHRVLKPGGKAIVAVPFFFYLHNEPNDYWRYSKHGLRQLFQRSDFRLLELNAGGGLLSFLHHVLFTAIVGLLYPFPLVGSATLYVARWSGRLVVELDYLIGANKIFPLYYFLVVKKR